MALLARRSVQDLLDDLSVRPCLSKSLIARLNLLGKASLDAEWELIVLSALSRVGGIEYEPQLGGSAKLDVRFKSPAGLQFTGEITALSDDEISRCNPVDELVKEVSRRLGKRGIRGGITISIGAERQRAAATLMLPPPNEFSQQIFNQGFHEFLDHITRAPTSPHTYRVHNDTAQVAISMRLAPGGSSSITRFSNRPEISSRTLSTTGLRRRLIKSNDPLRALRRDCAGSSSAMPTANSCRALVAAA